MESRNNVDQAELSDDALPLSEHLGDRAEVVYEPVKDGPACDPSRCGTPLARHRLSRVDDITMQLAISSS